MRIYYLIFNRILIFVVMSLILIVSSGTVLSSQIEVTKCYQINKEALLYSPVGLEVDSNENIYISTDSQVNVYNNEGKFLYAIRAPITGNMRMKMIENENIGIAVFRRPHVYILTKEGCLIEIIEDKDGSIRQEYFDSQSKEKTISGNTYKLSNVFGYTKVIKISSDGVKSTVFKIPIWKWLLKVVSATSYSLLIIGPFFIVRHIIRNSRK